MARFARPLHVAGGGMLREVAKKGMRTLAVVGAGGVVGVKLVERALATTDARIYAYTHGKVPSIPAAHAPRVTWAPLDIGDAEAVRSSLDAAQPDVVINPAAMTNVDACESRRAEAEAANAAGPRYLAEACVALGARLLHVSTDYVFPGDDANPGPYLEDAISRAVNYYGETKQAGERAVQEVCAGRVPWLVARTALVYGSVPGGRANFISWLAGELRAGRTVRVVSDQINTPTLADDLAAALLSLAERATEGVLHVAGPDLLTRVEWARRIADFYALDASLIEVTTTEALAQPAPRPLRSGLRTQRANELADVTMRGIRDGLEAMG
ncbi:MAG: sugar nucleotide-binding protein [Ktedonobacterales bacterium]